MSEPKRGWRHRGHLPHADFAGLTQAVTFRLADSLPAAALARIQRELARIDDDLDGNRKATWLRERVHTWLDAGHGSCWLRDATAQGMVMQALRRRDGESYRLEACTVMPNHVHVVVGVGMLPLGSIVRMWKGTTARRINQHLGRFGPLWGREYYDRFIRDEPHGIAAIRYVVNNPVRAGLVAQWRDWAGTWVASRWMKIFVEN